MAKRKKPFVLDERHKLAAEVFAQGDYCGLQEAAALVGVHRSTLWRWWQIPAFRRYCERVRRAAVAEYWKSPEVRKEGREMRRELRRKERDLERLNSKKQDAELARWMAAQGLPKNYIEEIVYGKNASDKHENKKRATPDS